MKIEIFLNSELTEFDVAPNTILLDMLRENGIKSVKKSCSSADCGSCTVLLDGRAVLACSMLAVQADGKYVLTVEGLEKNGKLDMVQKVYLEESAFQCGFCAPGLIMATKELVEKYDNLSEEEVKYHLAGNLCRCTGYEKQIHAVKKMFEIKKEGGKANVGATSNTPFTEKTNFEIVSHAKRKVDIDSFIRGKPVYTEDLAPVNCLFVKLLHSPYAHARIKNINTSFAEAIPGTELVLCYKNFGRVPYTRAGQGFPEPSPYDTVLFDNKVRFVGDTVALVAARTKEIAERALKAIEVEYEVLPQITDFEKSMEEGSPVIHDEEDSSGIFDANRNLASHYSMEIGNTEEIIKNSEVVLQGAYYYPKSQQVPMENHTAFSYLDDKNRLVVVSSTQVPFHARRILSKILEFPLGNIRVIKPRIGGGFGAKQGIIVEGYAAAVTLRTGKPAKIIFSREETFVNSYTRHDMKVSVKIGADKEGKVNAIDLHALSNTGAYGDHALTVAMVCGSKTLPLYNKVKAVKFSSDIVYTNLPNAGAYRGYGAPQGLLALDCILDELAWKVGKDPLEIKSMNTIREGEGSPIFQIMGEGREGVEQVARSCKLDKCIEEGKKSFHWEESFKKFGKGTEKDGKVIGVGCSLAMQGSGIAKVDMASASIKMNDDGSFNLMTGATDLGTGSDTILSQIAAEALTVPLEKIHIYSSDTDITPFDTGAYASSTTYVSGNAVLKACEKIKSIILEYASKLFKEPEKNLVLKKGKVLSMITSTELTLSEIGTKSFYNENQKQIAATSSFVGDESPIPFMASFMKVEVDLETGQVKIRETESFVDCGTAINPLLASGQIEGATLQAVGSALHEELKFSKDGIPVNANLFRYKIPDRASYGRINAQIVESYEPTGPFGAKSVSEIGIDTPTATILNAIFHATGVRLNRVPVNPEELLKRIKAIKK